MSNMIRSMKRKMLYKAVQKEKGTKEQKHHYVKKNWDKFKIKIERKKDDTANNR